MSSGSAEVGDEESPRTEQQLDGTDYALINGNHTSSEASDLLKTQSNAGSQKNNGAATTPKKQAAAKSNSTSWFAVPAPLKRVFDRFPLIKYPENELPMRVRGQRQGNVLYIFADEKDTVAGRPSFNPSCLKWQTYLKISGTPFKAVSSNNHASPNGSLPFLLTTTAEGTTPSVIPSNRLKRWIKEKAAGHIREPSDVRSEIYTSLLENCTRKAWLYQLYLHPANEAVVRRLYVNPSSSNPLVQLTILSQLRSAAESEIVKASRSSSGTHRIDEKEILRDAEEAFEALSTLLADSSWFFPSRTEPHDQGSNEKNDPSPFDASVFAYTHLILDDSQNDKDGVMKWHENDLKTILKRYGNLVRHRERILDMYY